jgi:hypothetical protein
MKLKGPRIAKTVLEKEKQIWKMYNIWILSYI